MARAIDADATRVLARQFIESDQTRGRRSQIRHTFHMARPVRHDREQRTGIDIVEMRQFGLIGIIRWGFLHVAFNSLAMKRYLRADGAIAGRAAGINIEHRVEACFSKLPVQIEPLARRVNALAPRNIA